MTRNPFDLPLLALICSSVVAGGLAASAVWRAHVHLADAPVLAAREARRRPWLRSVVVRRLSGNRLDAAEATGLALFAAFVVIVTGAFVVGMLTLVVRSTAGRLRIDRTVAEWGQESASAWSTDVIRAITHLGDTRTVVALALVVAIAAVVRDRDRGALWIPLFLGIVIAGDSALFNLLKEMLDRARPAFEESTASLGPSFPSGHSATAASGYAALAFVLAGRSSLSARAWFAGAAVGIAVAVAISRVMLGVHWLTDTVCGLALGWAWFAVVAVAFGGRLLRFGATVEAMEAGVIRRPAGAPRSSAGGR